MSLSRYRSHINTRCKWGLNYLKTDVLAFFITVQPQNYVVTASGFNLTWHQKLGVSNKDTRHDTLTSSWLYRRQWAPMSCEKQLLGQPAKLTWRNLTMLSLGLASFFSVGALLKSSAGSTLSQLLYFPWKRRTKLLNRFSKKLQETQIRVRTVKRWNQKVFYSYYIHKT